ncbi:MAG: MFS transporter [Chloroflexia bacterium]
MSDQISASAGAEAAEAVGFKDLMRNRNFRFLWLGQVISDFGDSLTSLSLLFLINKLTGSTAALATMLIVLTIPQITFGLVAGVYVDRLDRKRIMIVSDLLRGLLVLGFMFVASPDLVWLLYVIAFVQASIGTLFTPARSALLPNIVPAQGLMAANSVQQTSRIIFGLLGTAAAGVLIGTFEVFWPAFTVDALTFFASVLLVSRIAGVQTRGTAGESTPGTVRVIFGQLADGMKIIARTPVLSGTLMAVGVAMLGMGAVNVLVIPLIINDLQVPATWFGAVELAQTAGMILSGSLVVVLARRLKPTGIISGSLVGIGAAISLLALVSSVWHIFPVVFAVGLLVTPLQASVSTIMQTSVSNQVRGRISSSLNTMISTTSLVSMGLAGVLGQAIGVRNVFVAGGAVIVVAGFAAAWVFRGYGGPTKAESQTAGAAVAVQGEPAS